MIWQMANLGPLRRGVARGNGWHTSPNPSTYGGGAKSKEGTFHGNLGYCVYVGVGPGPMVGQSVTFNRFMAEKVPIAIERYTSESRRLYEVLNTLLADGPWHIARCPQPKAQSPEPALRSWSGGQAQEDPSTSSCVVLCMRCRPPVSMR